MKKSEINKLDKQWSLTIRENFKNKCVICGNEGNQPHHYVGRRNRATRWYIPNGVLLCYKHHTFGTQSAHQDPEWFRKQLLDLWGEEWLKDLVKQSNKIFKGTYSQVIEHYEGKDTYI